MSVFSDLGKYILLISTAFKRPEKWSVYWKEIIREMYSIGVGSVWIISIISIFMGAVTSVQTAFQLVSSFIPSSVIGQITRDNSILELSPTIGALVLAGKTGSNIASQIGTMRVTEQIDALEVMGINSPGYLILPKIIAGITTIPLLVILSITLSILGGGIAAVMAGALSSTDYINGVQGEFKNIMLTTGMIKSVVYAFIITSVSAYQGFYTNGGALEVGEASTRAVVVSCILILCADYLIAQLLL
jgi:phospholipid/cholesterol/gamma-HCH transport system permease protein